MEKCRPPTPPEPLVCLARALSASASLLPRTGFLSYEGSKPAPFHKEEMEALSRAETLPWVTKIQNETQSHRVRHGARKRAKDLMPLPALQLPLR